MPEEEPLHEFALLKFICKSEFTFSVNDEAWFLSEEEKETMHMKKQGDIIERGADKFDKKWIMPALKEPFVWLIGTSFHIICRNKRVWRLLAYYHCRSRVRIPQAQQHDHPVYVPGAISLVIQVCYSDKLKERGVFIVCSWIPVAVEYLMCVGSSKQNVGYAGMYVLVLGFYVISTLAVTWVTTNLSPDDKRTIMPLAYPLANVSNLVSSQLYPSQQEPRYVQGNAVSGGLPTVAACLYGACWFLLRRRNQEKERLIASGATTNGMEGDRSLQQKYIF